MSQYLSATGHTRGVVNQAGQQHRKALARWARRNYGPGAAPVTIVAPKRPLPLLDAAALNIEEPVHG